MVRSVIHKMLSVVLALLVVLASFSVSIDQHFCGSKLVNVALFSKAEACCKNEIPKAQTLQFSKKPCCSNVSILIEGIDNYPTASAAPVIDGFVAVTAQKAYNVGLLEFESKATPSNINYKPPPLIVNIQVRDQVFLI